MNFLFKFVHSLTGRIRRYTKPKPRPKRICATCHKAILKRHRYFFEGSTVKHKNCENPQLLPANGTEESKQKELIS